MSRSLAEAVALSPFQMLVHAIHEHQRKHEGRKPRYFILHPNVWRAVLAAPELRFFSTGTDCTHLGGVEVRESTGQSVPVMVDCLGVAQEL